MEGSIGINVSVPRQRISIAIYDDIYGNGECEFTDKDILKWAKSKGPVLGAALAQRLISCLSQIIVEALELK